MGIFGQGKREKLETTYVATSMNSAALKMINEFLANREKLFNGIKSQLDSKDSNEVISGYINAYVWAIKMEELLKFTTGFNKSFGTIFADSLTDDQKRLLELLDELRRDLPEMRKKAQAQLANPDGISELESHYGANAKLF